MSPQSLVQMCDHGVQVTLYRCNWTWRASTKTAFFGVLESPSRVDSWQTIKAERGLTKHLTLYNNQIFVRKRGSKARPRRVIYRSASHSQTPSSPRNLCSLGPKIEAQPLRPCRPGSSNPLKSPWVPSESGWDWEIYFVLPPSPLL